MFHLFCNRKKKKKSASFLFLKNNWINLTIKKNANKQCLIDFHVGKQILYDKQEKFKRPSTSHASTHFYVSRSIFVIITLRCISALNKGKLRDHLFVLFPWDIHGKLQLMSDVIFPCAHCTNIYMHIWSLQIKILAQKGWKYSCLSSEKVQALELGLKGNG